MKNALRDALDQRGYTTLTPVQQAVLDPDLEGADLLVSAQTGSGKTLGFGLAIAPTLLQDAEAFEQAGAPLGLVIAPTRELALQVKRELSWLFAKAGAYLASCVGGMDMRDERRALARGAHIVVATPGRLRDHIMRGSIDLTNLRAVVLDEADEMLDLGFREDLEFILGESPKERQTLLFSATVPKIIAKLAENYQRDAVRVVTKSETTQHADISYEAYTVAERDAENAVINTLLYHKAPNSIVFGNTRAMVNRLTTRLSNRGFQVVALSGELSQAERTHALQAMRDGRAQVCVATDVAARGIDLPNLDLVVHAELPNNHETLLHRSGRTGRAGRKGVSAVICTKRTRKKAERILSMAKVRAVWSEAPSADAVQAREAERMFSDEAWQTPIDDSEQETVEKLQAEFSPAQLAASYLRLYRSVRSAPEELSHVDAKPEPKQEFGESVWFSISGGHNAGAEPRRLLPMICKASSLTRDDIGAIRVQQDESFVQVKASSAATLAASVGADGALEEGAVLKQLETPPVIEPSRRPGPGNKGGKPRFDKPKFDKPKSDRSKSDKPRDKGDKPFRKDRDDRPKTDSKPSAKHQPKSDGRPKKSTPPVDWNDDPAPRKRKPKPQDRPNKNGPNKNGQNKGGPNKSKPNRDRGASDKRTDTKPSKDAHGDAKKPFKRAASMDPSESLRKPRHKGKGAPPPVGKPSSKKNRARAMAAKAGEAPRRPKGGKPKPS